MRQVLSWYTRFLGWVGTVLSAVLVVSATVIEAGAPAAGSGAPSGELRISPLLAQVLIARGYASGAAAHAFLNARLMDLHEPSLLPGMDDAADRIVSAIRNVGEMLALSRPAYMSAATRNEPATLTISVPYGKPGPKVRSAHSDTR